MSGAMRLVEFTANRCVVFNPPAALGFYFGGAMIILNTAFLIACRSSEWLRKRTDNGWLGWVITVLLIPAWLSGHSDRITLDRQTQMLTVRTRMFFVFWHTREIPLDVFTEANVAGKQAQLQLNFSNGNFFPVGSDSFLGGRDLAANAINAWMRTYRTGAPLPSPDTAAFPSDQQQNYEQPGNSSP